MSVTPEEMRAAVTTPVFQPYRGETGRAWVAKEYGVTMDTSSFMSSETERDETDDEVCSFDLGPETYDPNIKARLPSDEWLDDHQQGLKPGSSEPRYDPYDKYLAMPTQPSILDLMRTELETGELSKPPPSPECAPPKTISWDYDYIRDEPPTVQRLTEEPQQHSTPRADPRTPSVRPRPALELPRPRASSSPERAPPKTIRWDYDYIRDEPPTVQRLTEEPQQHSTPRADPRMPSVRPRPALELPRPRASSAPPASHPAKRVALQYLPVTEEVTPPITPPRAQPRTPDPEIVVVPDTPSPVTKPGRSRGRGTWRAPQKPAPGVGTRSMTRLAELEMREKEQAQAACAQWPTSPDISGEIQQLTRELHISDVPRNTHGELERVHPSGEDDTELTSRQPPAAGLISRQQDTYLIPPPSRAVGGVRGRSVSVRTATLGLIHRQDPALAAQLREDPGSLMSQWTRRVYSTMRLIRTGMIGQMASLQQWEEAINRQDDL